MASPLSRPQLRRVRDRRGQLLSARQSEMLTICSPAALRSSICVAITCSALSALGAGCNDAKESPERTITLTETRLYEASDSLNDIRGIALGRRGELWVIGSPAPFIHHFDSSGALIASFGRAGQGPGELATPHEIFAPTELDTLVRVWSPSRGVLTAFSRAGTPVTATRPLALTQAFIPGWVDKIDYVRYRPMARFGGGYLVQDVPPRETGLTSATQIANARILVLDSVGTVTDTLIDFSTLTGPARAAPTVVYLAAVPVWTTCPDGTAVVADPFGMKIIRYAVDGRVIRTDTLPVDAPRITDDDIRRMLRNFASVREVVQTTQRTVPDSMVERLTQEYLTKRREEIGTVGPPAVRLACDEQSNVWLQLYDTTDDPRGLGREWVVVSDGRVVRRYRFPARFQPMALHAGTALGVRKDSLDVERVAAVQYRRPGRQSP